VSNKNVREENGTGILWVMTPSREEHRSHLNDYRQPATSWVHYTTVCNTHSSAPEDGRNHGSKHVELVGIINKPLLLHLVGIIVSMIRGQTNIKLRSVVEFSSTIRSFSSDSNHRWYFLEYSIKFYIRT
jgi:hypothetical protein